MNRLLLLFLFISIVVGHCFAETSDDAKFKQACEYYEASEYDKAAKIFQELAAKNHVASIGMLGSIAKEQNEIDEAIRYWTKAAEHGDIDAQICLVNYCDNDSTCSYWAKVALKNLEALANKGDADAMFDIAGLYSSGWLDKGENWEEAIAWYEKAANAGNTEAMNELGNIYFNKKEIQKSYKYFLKGAKVDDMECVIGVGQVIYNYGKDYPELVDAFSTYCAAVFEDELSLNAWYYKAATMGSPKAEAAIGYYKYRDGLYMEAKQWLKKAKDKGAEYFILASGVYSVEEALAATNFYINNHGYEPNHDWWEFDKRNNRIYLKTIKNSSQGVVTIDNDGNLIEIFVPFTHGYDSIHFENNHISAEKNGEIYVYKYK